MPDPTTPAKGLTQPQVGGDNNVWGGLLNTDLSLIDSALGGTVSIAISGTTTSITSTQAQSTGYEFTGTLTAQNTITWPAFSGMASISNQTSNGWAISCGISGGSYASILSGEVTAIWSDGTNFVRLSQPIYPGEMRPYAGTVAPAGYLLTDGGAHSRTTYAALFNQIGTTFGVGDGSTTFNVPNTCGRVLAGYDPGNATGLLTASTSQGVSASALGNTGGEQAHTNTLAETAVHNHGVNDPTHAHGVSDPTHNHNYNVEGNIGSPAGYSDNSPNEGNQTVGIYSGGATTSTDLSSTNITIEGAYTEISIQNAGSGAAHNNVQPTLIVGWIIKY